MAKYILPKLPYSYNALEPYIDAKTMEIHHSKHHQLYVDKLNEVLEKYPQFYEKSLGEILSKIKLIPEDIRQMIINHGGGHYNHSIFWTIMGPKKGGEPKGNLGKEISKKWGSFDNFKKEFTNAALGIFGSGWAWLGVDSLGKKLEILTTPNQNTIITGGKEPILNLDVWEHAYYLKYQNRRKDYVEAWWNVVNWEEAEKRYKKFIQKK